MWGLVFPAGQALPPERAPSRLVPPPQNTLCPVDARACTAQAIAFDLGDKEAKSVKWYVQRNRDRLGLTALVACREAYQAAGQTAPDDYADGLTSMPSLPDSMEVRRREM